MIKPVNKGSTTEMPPTTPQQTPNSNGADGNKSGDEGNNFPF